MAKNEKNTEFSCRIHERYWLALDGLSTRVQNDVLGALVRAFFTGDSQADSLKGIARNMYLSLEEPVLFSRKRAIAGKKGGEAKGQANMEANAKQNGKQTTKQNASLKENREKREEIIESECVLATGIGEKQNAPTLNEISDFFQSKGGTEQAATRFYRHYAAQGWKSGSGQPIENWQLKAEQWIDEDAPTTQQQPQEPPRIAYCPKCHEERESVSPGLFRCNDCEITWRAE